MQSDYLRSQLVILWHTVYTFLLYKRSLSSNFHSSPYIIFFSLAFSSLASSAISLSQFSNFLMFFKIDFSFPSIKICSSYYLLFLNKLVKRTVTSSLSFSPVLRLSILNNISGRFVDHGLQPSLNQKLLVIVFL